MPDIDILAPSPWQMTFGERAALEGILAQVRPKLAIEIGTAEGGSLRRIAAHSEAVHSFDLVEPEFAVRDWGNVRLHTGDSHALLPAYLAELAFERRNVDFVLVDGDHTADGVERDLNDLLASPAIGHTVILVHDTLNDEVRRGVARVPYDAHAKVVYCDLDFVGGHLSHGGAFHHQLWGGIALVVVDDRAGAEPVRDSREGEFYDLFELYAPVRDALVAHEGAGEPVGPGRVPAFAGPSDGAVRELQLALEATRIDLANARAAAVAIQNSPSWRVTAPLRRAKRVFKRTLRRP